MFIKQERVKVKGVKSMPNKRRKNDDSSWASKYSIQIYGSIATSKAKKKNGRKMQYKR